MLGGLSISGIDTLGVDVLDVQGNGAVRIDEGDALALINAGLSFADNDTVTLELDAASEVEGTYLSA